MECTKCGLEFKNTNGLNQHINKCKLNKELVLEIKNDYIKNYLSLQDLSDKYKISKNLIRKILINNMRTTSEACKVSKKPRKKHTDGSKQILREKRLLWMKNNPEKTAWRTSNMSYPEKVFNDYVIKNEYDKKYLITREKSIFPYYIDFAFENEKVAIEIDGSQHLLLERKLKDEKKDKLLNELGWKVIRIAARSVIKDTVNTLEEIFKMINVSDKIENNNKVGIFHYESKYSYYKKERINGLTEKEYKNQENRNKEQEKYITLILNSNIDFSKFGWVNKVSIILNRTPQKVNRWMKKYMFDFYNTNCFKRNTI